MITKSVNSNKSGISRAVDPTNNKGRGYKYLWEVYPDNGWNSKCGPKPLLGTVRADSEFDAKYAAYDNGLLPYNFTFGPEVKRLIKSRDQK